MNKFLRQAVKLVPDVIPYLSNKAKTALKVQGTGDFNVFSEDVKKLVQKLYDKDISGDEFKKQLAEIVKLQLTNAYNSAWYDAIGSEDIPSYLDEKLQEDIKAQLEFIDGYYNDIIRDRALGIGLVALLARADLWGARAQESYNNAMILIGSNDNAAPNNLIWIEGDTVEKCDTCLALDGIVAPASLWDELKVYPQMGDNPRLECHGWRCQCQLVVTDKPVTPNARAKILAAVL
jgi:hypothetical protein